MIPTVSPESMIPTVKPLRQSGSMIPTVKKLHHSQAMIPTVNPFHSERSVDDSNCDTNAGKVLTMVGRSVSRVKTRQ
eukprot:scaffold23711_cov34-Attheya_sp.AAC.5